MYALAYFHHLSVFLEIHLRCYRLTIMHLFPIIVISYDISHNWKII